MKNPFSRLAVALSALRQLGAERAMWYAAYQIGLRSGYYRLETPGNPSRLSAGQLRSPYAMPDAERLRAVMGEGLPEVINEADEIAAGKVRLFGAQPVPLQLAPPDSSRHWTYYEGRPSSWGVDDIKLIWEPARFGWVYPLARAYRVTQDERYPTAFWHHFEAFQAANPTNLGPNWASAQEVGLRLLALLFAARAFEDSAQTTSERMDGMARAVAEHAERIPATLAYARAQNNNHRVVEGLALYAAGVSLPDHPLSEIWQEKGWHELNAALISQIEPDGTYTQQSMNYHRLMLQAAVQGPVFGRTYPITVQIRLEAAALWLLRQIDPLSGRAPNLGNNDGALILPLAAGGFSDYRPAAQAAARAFLGQPGFAPGAWDETSLWLGQTVMSEPALEELQLFPLDEYPEDQLLGNAESWGTLRAVSYQARPAHADQLHVDLWWRGENIALDAGTYRYTAPEPWDNALTHTRVHNTVEVDGQDQMRRAGRFLWLDWAQGEFVGSIDSEKPMVICKHDGYRKIGVLHRRALEQHDTRGWWVQDELLPYGDATAREYDIRLHWLLPDWPWQLDANSLRLEHPGGGWLRLTISGGRLSLIRAGELLAGEGPADPILGWHAPTYNHKFPALSLTARDHAALPYKIVSEWLLDPGTDGDKLE